MKEQAKPIFFLTFLICHLPLIESMAQTEGIIADVLGTTDIGNKAAMDGISGGFYPNIPKYYDQGRIGSGRKEMITKMAHKQGLQLEKKPRGYLTSQLLQT